MSALGSFVERQGVMSCLRAFAPLGLVVALGVTGVATLESLSHKGELTAGPEIHETVQAHASRLADRLYDMRFIQKALHEDPLLTTPGGNAVSRLTSLQNALYRETPGADLETLDGSRLRADHDLSQDQSLVGAIEALNSQKMALLEMTRALKGVTRSLSKGYGVSEEIAKFDLAVSSYGKAEGSLTETIRAAIADVAVEAPAGPQPRP